MSPARSIRFARFARPARLTLSSCTFAALAFVALASGCQEDSLPSPVQEDSQAGLQLPAGPSAAGQTLGQLGFHTVQLGSAGTPMYLSGHVPAAIRSGEAAGQAVLSSLATAYRLSAMTTFSVLSDEKDETQTLAATAGRRFIKLQQVHAGVPVVGGEVVVQAESDGAIGAVLGELVPELRIVPSDPAAVLLTGDQALARALTGRALGGQVEVSEPPALRVYALEGAPELTYRAVVSYNSASGYTSEEIFVSPRDGKVVAQLSRIYTALSRTVYTLRVCLASTGSLPGTKTRGEGDATVADATVNNVYDHGGSTYYFYKHFFGRDSYDNKGAPLRSSVHITFFGGASCSPNNAAWIAAASQMVYGDGDNMILKDLSLGLDVTAHEITHAVTSSTSNLAYLNESGALNEGMSDVFGSGIHAWKVSGGSELGNPTEVLDNADTWLLGKEVAGPSLPGGSLRFMADPTKDGQSKDYYPERVMPGSIDNGGVHLNSGLLNLVHVLLSDGGKHPRSKTTVQVPKIGIEKALRIWYMTNTKLLTSSSNFQAARYASAQAAENLYGRCSPEWTAVHRAWDAVAVPGPWSLCVQPKPPQL